MVPFHTMCYELMFCLSCVLILGLCCVSIFSLHYVAIFGLCYVKFLDAPNPRSARVGSLRSRVRAWVGQGTSSPLPPPCLRGVGAVGPTPPSGLACVVCVPSFLCHLFAGVISYKLLETLRRTAAFNNSEWYELSSGKSGT